MFNGFGETVRSISRQGMTFISIDFIFMRARNDFVAMFRDEEFLEDRYRKSKEFKEKQSSP